MPSLSGSTYFWIFAVVAVLGLGYGLCCTNPIATLSKINEKIDRHRDWTAATARLRKVKKQLEDEIDQLQEECVDLKKKIEIANVSLENVLTPLHRHGFKAVKLEMSGFCVIEFKPSRNIERMSCGSVPVSSSPRHLNAYKESNEEEKVKLEPPAIANNLIDIGEEDCAIIVEANEAMDVESVNLQIEINKGLSISGETQEDKLLLERKKQLLWENTRLKDQIREDTLRQNQLLQENKEQENRKGLLSGEVRGLEFLKKNLQEQVRQLKERRKKIRAFSRYRRNSSINVTGDARSQDSTRSLSPITKPPLALRSKGSFSARVKLIRENTLDSVNKASLRRLSNTHSTPELCTKEKHAEMKNTGSSWSDVHTSKSPSVEEIPQGKIEDSNEVSYFSKSNVVLPDRRTTRSEGVGSSEWTVCSMFLT